MENQNYTPGEIRILSLIAESDYQDETLLNVVWQVTETKEDRGYMSSCVKKGLVGCDNSNKGEETCWLTQEGKEVYLKSK